MEGNKAFCLNDQHNTSISARELMSIAQNDFEIGTRVRSIQQIVFKAPYMKHLKMLLLQSIT